MDKLYGWTVARSGASMTITHSTGKISGIVQISAGYREGASPRQITVAIRDTGARYELVLA